MDINNTVTEPSSLRQNKKIGLDLLRAYAILSVVYFHGWNIILNITESRLYLSIKFDNVTIFFVITGFLITLKLIKLINKNQLNTKAIKNFWVQRLIRTYPLYFLMVAMVGIIHFIYSKNFPDNYFKYFLYSQNINSAHPAFFPELWSLAIQEWFYLLFPLILWVIVLLKNANKQITVLRVIVALICLITIYRLTKINDSNYMNYAYWDANLRQLVTTRLDSILFGGLMAYVLLVHPIQFKKYAIHCVLIGLLILIINKILLGENWFYTNYLYLTMTAIGSALLLPFFYGLDFNLKIINKCIIYISTISYTMYLVNLTPVLNLIAPNVVTEILEIFPNLNQYMHVIGYAIFWSLTLLIATLLHRWFADPVTKYLQNKYVNYKLQTI